MPDINGTTYDEGTLPEIAEILERCRVLKTRVRFRYGSASGQDWGDSCNMEGYIGRSCGRIKAPLVIHNKRSLSGPAILTACIIRIETTRGKQLLYQHPAYKPPKEDTTCHESPCA